MRFIYNVIVYNYIDAFMNRNSPKVLHLLQKTAYSYAYLNDLQFDY